MPASTLLAHVMLREAKHLEQLTGPTYVMLREAKHPEQLTGLAHVMLREAKHLATGSDQFPAQMLRFPQHDMGEYLLRGMV